MEQTKIIFLHHSTGSCILKGNTSKYLLKLGFKGEVFRRIEKYNKLNKTFYSLDDLNFPKSSPYGWKNYPFDYYNIWVKNGGNQEYKQEPTLEILTKKYDLIVFKHCFPVGLILDDSVSANAETKTLSNYYQQYLDLKIKLLQFPDTKFLIWTGAALTKDQTTEEQARRAKRFFLWVKNEWDEPGDNIYLWDFYELETEGGLYLKPEFALSSNDSHPNPKFSGFASELFVNRIVDVIEGRGDTAPVTGEKLNFHN
jgi:hypothetical protein